jgi:hypothetical protein
MLKSKGASKQCTPFTDFKSGCSSFRLDEGVLLETTCQSKDGNRVRRSFEINKCFTNNKGLIQWNGKDAGFLDSCDGCSLSGTTLSCRCKKTRTGFLFPMIDLNKFIGVQADGTVNCKMC